MAAVAGLFVLTTVCHAAEIQVRVLSAKNGRPPPEKCLLLVILDLAIQHVAPHTAEHSFTTRPEYTDGLGGATFHIPIPLSGDAVIDITGLADYCSHPSYKAAVVFQTGVAEQFLRACPHRPLKKWVVRTQPGEIVMYSGEYSRWERLLYFPWPS